MIKNEKTKSLPITKRMVMEAYLQVKANRGIGGVDGESLKTFEEDLPKKLYKIWNRLSSGSYFPPAVLEVKIPKSNGSLRSLGIPTISDRIAQQVIKSYLEPRLDKVFHEQSYGYRPNRSAHQALSVARSNAQRYEWLIDLDISNFFGELSHELLMKALEVHVSEKWVKMYIQRWLEAPKQLENGTLILPNGKGTPQGGVISPLLANLYLHYSLDKWLDLHYKVPFERYADDVVIHCISESMAHQLLASIRSRLRDCGLRLNEAKTQIVCCRKNRRQGNQGKYPITFDFLGYRFQPMRSKDKYGRVFLGYDCAISPKSIQRITQKWKRMKIHRWVKATIELIAGELNPILRGIIHYYGKFRRKKLSIVFKRLHYRIVKWLLRKYKRLGKSVNKAYKMLRRIRRQQPDLFYHWKLKYSVM